MCFWEDCFSWDKSCLEPEHSQLNFSSDKTHCKYFQAFIVIVFIQRRRITFSSATTSSIVAHGPYSNVKLAGSHSENVFRIIRSLLDTLYAQRRQISPESFWQSSGHCSSSKIRSFVCRQISNKYKRRCRRQYIAQMSFKAFILGFHSILRKRVHLSSSISSQSIFVSIHCFVHNTELLDLLVHRRVLVVTTLRKPY